MAVPPETSERDESASDDEYLEAAIGPRNASYYLRQFSRISSGSSVISWNWAAFLVAVPWLLYRKMWQYAAIYLASPFALYVLLNVLVEQVPVNGSMIVSTAVAAYLLTLFVVFPMFANALYYHAVAAKIARIKRFGATRDSGLRVLSAQGGTNTPAAIVVVACSLPVITMLAVIGIPTLVSYSVRAEVVEGLALAEPAQAAVAETILSEGLVPYDRVDAGLSPNADDTSGRYVESLEIVSGRIDITYGNDADDAIAGKLLSLTPYVDERGIDSWNIVWRCGYARVPVAATATVGPYSAGTIDKRYLPASCR